MKLGREEAGRLAGWPAGRPDLAHGQGMMGRNCSVRGREKEVRGINPSFLPSFHLSVLRYEKICASHGAAAVVSRIPKTASI